MRFPAGEVELSMMKPPGVVAAQYYICEAWTFLQVLVEGRQHGTGWMGKKLRKYKCVCEIYEIERMKA